MGLNDIHSLSHTKWNCKYHIVFAPKYRRQVFYKEKREAVGKILRQLCEWKGVNILEAEVCPNHVHMLVEIPPKVAVSSFTPAPHHSSLLLEIASAPLPSQTLLLSLATVAVPRADQLPVPFSKVSFM